MEKPKRVYLSPPHMGGEEITLVQEAFASNWITTLGPQVEAFEKEVCNFVGLQSSVALSSGTTALHMGIKLLDVKAGDFVFCNSLTFAASANPIVYEGGVPVFIDSDPNSWGLSPQALERAFETFKKRGKLPKAVVLVNLYGQSSDMDPLLELCAHYQVPVLEDAAESIGATYKGKQSGSFGKYSIFSFNGNKIITSSGGGILLSNDKAGIERARFLSTQARDPAVHYQHSEIGYNYRMSNLLAAVGRAQFRLLEDRIERRRAIFARYQEALSDLPGVSFMPEASFGRSTRWLIAMTVDPATRIKPMDVVNALEEVNAESRPAWKPMHLQPVFSQCEYFANSDKNSFADHVYEVGLILPSGSAMTAPEQVRIVESIRKLFKKV